MASTGGSGALNLAKALALLVPAALLAGAYAFQYIGGLHPCEMCYWQRWPHMAALALAIAAYLFKGMPDGGRSFVWLAALAMLVSGGIGVWHSGVEAGIFSGVTSCAAGGGSLEDIMSRPLIRCDEIQAPFPILGLSMAGWNAVISIAAALVIAWLSLKRPERRETA